MRKCVRCSNALDIFEGHDIINFEEFLLAEGIRAEDIDILCDDCVVKLVENQPEEAP